MAKQVYADKQQSIKPPMSLGWNSNFVKNDKAEVKSILEALMSTDNESFKNKTNEILQNNKHENVTKLEELKAELCTLQGVTDPVWIKTMNTLIEHKCTEIEKVEESLQKLCTQDKSQIVWTTFVCTDKLLEILCKKDGCLNWHPCHDITQLVFGKQHGRWVWERLQKWNLKFPARCSAPYLAAVMQEHKGWRQTVAFCVTAVLLQGNTYTGHKIINTSADVTCAFEMLREANRKCGLPFYAETDRWWPTRGWNGNFDILCLWDATPAIELRPRTANIEPRRQALTYQPGASKALKGAVENAISKYSSSGNLDMVSNAQVANNLQTYTIGFESITEKDVTADFRNAIGRSDFPGLFSDP